MMARRVMAASRRLWTPSEMTTALWLDAADASTITQDANHYVSQWSDKSGNALHATQSTQDYKPLYVNQGVVTDGSNDYLQSALHINGWINISVAIVFNKINSVGAVSIGYSPETLKGIITGGGSTAYFFGGRPDGSTYTSAGQGSETTNKVLGCGSYDCSNLKSYLNGGTPVTTAVSTTSIIAEQNLYIGSMDARYFNSINLNELIVLNSLFSTDVRQKLEGYLAHKWSLTANLPADHPYKFGPPRV